MWDARGWLLTSIVVLWQFPHFMAIAWLYKDQYALAGFRMLTREDPSGLAVAWHALLPAVALIPVSMACMQPQSAAGWLFAVLAALVAAPQIRASFRFLMQRDQKQARVLLRSSLIYLPAILLLAVVRWVVL